MQVLRVCVEHTTEFRWQCEICTLLSVWSRRVINIHINRVRIISYTLTITNIATMK
jgi:hypothetical protein